MSYELSCEASMSDAVLQAARSAMPADPLRWIANADLIRKAGEKNAPLIPLLMALLDASQSVARAIADNAWDDNKPVSRELTDDLERQCREMANDVGISSQCPDCANWSLPSCTGKELV